MIIEKIMLKGFLSYLEEEIDFRNEQQQTVLLIAGENGEGKSALLESVPFCFWGVGRGRNISDYINDKCESVRIEVIFLMENIRYKKIRQHGKSNINELYIDKNNKELENSKWKLISDDTKKKTDLLLSSIIGLDYNIFSNSVFFGQKEASSFIEGTAADRKELLSNLLGIDVYEKAEDAAKENTKDINSKIQAKNVVFNSKIVLVEKKDTVSESLKSTRIRLAAVEKEMEIVEKNINESQQQRESIKIKISNLQKDKDRFDDLSERLKKQLQTKTKNDRQLQNDKKELEDAIDDGIEEVETLQAIISAEPDLLEKKSVKVQTLKDLELKKSKLLKYKEKIKAFRDSKEQLLEKQTELNTLIRALNIKKKKIKSSTAICPVTDKECDQLSEVNKNKIVQEIESEENKYNESLVQIQTDLETASEKILELDQKIETISKINESILERTKELQTIENNIEKLEKCKEDLPQIKKRHRAKVDKMTDAIEKIESENEDLQEEIEKLTVTVNELESQITTDYNEELRKFNKRIESLTDDKDDLLTENQDLVRRLGQLENEIGQIQQAEDDCKKIKSDIDELNESLRVYMELAIAFGKNGIQKEIINSNVPILEEVANDLLMKFTKDGKFKIKFDLDPITKSGKLKKSGGLDIIISEKGKIPRELNMYSGGETVRITFAILLSLSHLLTERAGKKSQTLIIDERVAALDQEGINQFIEIVKYIANQYKKIFIVSHISELKEAFSNKIEVIKNETTGSKVKYFNG